MLLSSVEWLIARRYLRAQRKNIFVSFISLFSMLGVAIGSFALVLVLSGINGFETQITQQMMGKDAHLDVVRYGHAPIENWEKLMAEISSQKDVEATSPFVISKVGISSRIANDGIVIYGIDALRAKNMLNISKNIRYGEYHLDSIPDTSGRKMPSILLGLELAERLGVSLGEKVVLQTFQNPELGGTPKLVQCLVSGIFQTGMYEYDANLAYISVPTAQNLLGFDNRVTGIQVNLNDIWQSSAFAEQLTEKLGGDFVASDWKEKNRTLLKWMGLEKILFGGVISLIILVAAFNIISSLIMLVTEKTREIGILRSMGFSAWSILRIFMTVGGFIGFIGTTLGTGIGLVVAYLQIQYGIIQLPADVYIFATLPMQINPLDIVLVFVISNLICLLATIPPALKAAFLHPVRAIRHE